MYILDLLPAKRYLSRMYRTNTGYVPDLQYCNYLSPSVFLHSCQQLNALLPIFPIYFVLNVHPSHNEYLQAIRYEIISWVNAIC
jgi:hypothetical protein